MYFSAGPFFSLLRTRDHYIQEYSTKVEDNTYRRYSWAAGAILGLGLECHLYDFVSVLGEYNATFSYGWEGSKPGPADERVISFDLERIRIGVCVRF